MDLESLETPFVDTPTLLCELQGYHSPLHWISRQVKKGALVRLKNGLYYIAGRDYSPAHAANRLYGPSYVSLQWALSYYGLIPERTVTITSITTKRKKQYETPLGCFTYHHLRTDRFALAYNRVDHAAGHFLLASPEKALVDFVFYYCDTEDLAVQLLESHRLTAEDLKNLDQLLLAQIADEFRSPIIYQLIKVLRCL